MFSLGWVMLALGSPGCALTQMFQKELPTDKSVVVSNDYKTRAGSTGYAMDTATAVTPTQQQPVNVMQNPAAMLPQGATPQGIPASTVEPPYAQVSYMQPQQGAPQTLPAPQMLPGGQANANPGQNPTAGQNPGGAQNPAAGQNPGQPGFLPITQDRHQRNNPTVGGSMLNLAPHETPIEKAIELVRKIDACEADNRQLLIRIRALEASSVKREDALSESMREVEAANSDVIKTKNDLQTLRKEITALKARMKQLEKEDSETMMQVIKALEALIQK